MQPAFHQSHYGMLGLGARLLRLQVRWNCLQIFRNKTECVTSPEHSHFISLNFHKISLLLCFLDFGFELDFDLGFGLDLDLDFGRTNQEDS